MWVLLRIILLVANAGLFAITAYHMSRERGDLTCVLRSKAPLRGYKIVPGTAHLVTNQGYALLTLFVVNFVYLLGHKGSDLGRVFRLIGLWFDAKGGELRQRADRSRQDK